MISCMAFFFVQRALAAEKPVKVFILAGQSNMEGKGFPRPLAWQVSQPAYRERYQHLIQDSDCDAFVAALERSLSEDPKAPLYRWSSRSDVWVDFHDRHGDLSV
jgi:alpha-galactosidase